jgi:hypothetical protein
MTVPTPSFGPNGFITPAEPDILAAVKDEINAAFGNELNMADETPQGQLAVSQTAAIGNANDAFVFLSQQMDPAYNIGRYQDAIARIYFIERIPSTSTVVTITCLGLEGVVIPQFALMLSDDGVQYAAIDGGTIPASGTIDLQFQCIVPGPIPAPAGSITTIYQSVNGWDEAINNSDGVIGRDTETREEFEQRRALSVAHNSQGSLPSVLGAVLTTDGVLDAFVTENVNQTPQNIKGFTLEPNSIYVAAVGGTDADVAYALWTKKSPGCGYNGNTTVIVEDTQSGYTPPYPSYEVKFERPDLVTVIFSVTLANNQSVPANVVDLVQAAIVAAFAGEDGGQRARIGSNLFASRFYNAVSMLGSWSQIFTIKLGCSNAPAATFTGSIASSTLSVSALTSGIIGVGQQITGNGVIPGTIITSGFGTTWTLNNVQTVSSGVMNSVVASSDELSIDIDQSPVTAPGNTTVVLI